jgi:hypothetical protein
MALQTVTLQVPEHIYERARQLAEITDQPLEAVFLRELENAFCRRCLKQNRQN